MNFYENLFSNLLKKFQSFTIIVNFTDIKRTKTFPEGLITLWGLKPPPPYPLMVVRKTCFNFLLHKIKNNGEHTLYLVNILCYFCKIYFRNRC